MKAPQQQLKKLGDICIQDRSIIEPKSSTATKRPYLGLEHIVSQTGKILKDESLIGCEGRSATFAFDHRHVLYGKLRPYLNKVALPEFTGRCTTELIPLLPRPETDREFLALVLRRQETIDFAMQGKTGSRMPRADMDEMMKMEVPFVPMALQQQKVARLREQMEEVDHASAAVQAQVESSQLFVQSVLRESLKNAAHHTRRIAECLSEVTNGIGNRWNEFPVLGATRAGLAPAKESVGKNPGRYKPVLTGTIFYNPMRILLGSIAMVDEDDKPGITSPDYVVMRGVQGRLHPTWFYHWFRSPAGADFIQSLTRGAVRERLLFNRLAKAEITVPSWPDQLQAVKQLNELKNLHRSLESRLSQIALLPSALLRKAFIRT